MSSLTPSRTAASIGLQGFFVILCGLAVASLISRLPIPVSFGAVLAVVFGMAFLRRPDLGLLVVLLVRASTDMSFWVFGGALVSQNRSIGALPNLALIFILMLVGGLYVLSRNVPLLRLPGGWLLLSLLLIGLVGMLRSDSLLFSFNQWIRLVSVFIVYALAAYFSQSPLTMQRVIDVLAASFVLPALFGFYQLATGWHFYLPDVGVGRIFGTFAHPNAFGVYLVLIFSVFISQFLTQSGRRKFLALFMVMASVTLLLSTFARAAWVGAIIVLLTFGVLRSRKLLVIATLAAVIATAGVPAIRARFANPLEGSFASRLEIWHGTFDEWKSVTARDDNMVSIALDRLAGLGPGAVEVLTPRVLGGVAFAAHNDYLRVLVEYGLLGLGLYLTLLIVLFLSAYRAWRRSKDKLMASAALSFAAVTLAVLVMSVTDNIFAYTANQIYFWSLAGLTASARRLLALPTS